MKGTVKWFNDAKGYGFITDEGGKDHFVHYTSIQMEGRKFLNENDVVEFEVGDGTNGREQAVNVRPIITLEMVKAELDGDQLDVHNIKDELGCDKYVVVDRHNTIQSPEQGMSFEELVGYAGLHYPM